jgi:hypothetical protein
VFRNSNGGHCGRRIDDDKVMEPASHQVANHGLSHIAHIAVSQFLPIGSAVPIDNKHAGIRYQKFGNDRTNQTGRPFRAFAHFGLPRSGDQDLDRAM